MTPAASCNNYSAWQECNTYSQLQRSNQANMNAHLQALNTRTGQQNFFSPALTAQQPPCRAFSKAPKGS